jgi:hypothetical protein
MSDTKPAAPKTEPSEKPPDEDVLVVDTTNEDVVLSGAKGERPKERPRKKGGITEATVLGPSSLPR